MQRRADVPGLLAHTKGRGLRGVEPPFLPASLPGNSMMASAMARPSLENPSLYINSEVSWLSFNRRVLEEAEDDRNPLLERVKFLAITASNLDEFFEVRISGLVQRIEDGHGEPGPDGLSPVEERD